MDIEVFYKGVAAIGSHYSGSYPKASLEDIWPDCQQEPDEALRATFKRLRMESNHLPTLARIRDMVKAEGYRLRMEEGRQREERAAEEKEAFRRGQAKAFGDQAGLAKQSVMLVRSILSGKITRAQALEGMRHLDASYPAAGFATAGAHLANYYEREGHDLNKPCGLRDLSEVES